MYSVPREAAEAWATVEQADKLRRIQCRARCAIARVGKGEGGKTAGVGRGRQGSSARSGDSKPRGSCWNCGKGGRRMADCTTKRNSGSPGGQHQATAQPSGVAPGHSRLSRKFLSKKRTQHPTRVERVHSRAHFPLRSRAPFSRATGNRRVWTSVPLWCHRCHRCLPRDDSLWRQGCPFQRGVPQQLMRLLGFGLKKWLLMRKKSAI